MARGPRPLTKDAHVDVLIGAPAFDAVIVEEMARRHKLRGQIVAPGVVTTTASVGDRDLVFARQLLPRARTLVADSVSTLADDLVKRLSNDDERGWLAGTLRLDVDVSDAPRTGSRPRDDHPLRDGLIHLRDILEKKQVGRARKQGIDVVEGAPTHRVEFLLTEAWRGFLSSTSACGDPLTAWPSSFGAGRVDVKTDKSAPSSAHRKLDEALGWLGVVPDAHHTVLDLGAAPGGWSHVALRTGASVIAVDRGEMDPTLMKSGRVTHLKKDAFAHAPLVDADWLVCDIIAEPHRTLALLKEALVVDKLQAFVVTVKLTSPVDLDIVDDARALLSLHPQFVTRVKNLFHNKLEITLMGRRR